MNVIFVEPAFPHYQREFVRALQLLRSYQLADGRELAQAKEVLDAAALTYVAALAQALSTLLYYVFLLTGFSRRD